MSLLSILKRNGSTNSDDKSNTLEQHKISLDKTVINLSKTSPEIIDHKAKVKMVLDYSGSMSENYRSGYVQSVITRLLPLALRFDDDGELESYIFSNDYEQLEAVTQANYDNYVKTCVYDRMSMGGTHYAPVIEALHQTDDKHIPSFVIYITDGDNSDVSETNQIIRAICNDNMFIMFIGIGNENFSYLKTLDNLSGRVRDNTGFMKVKDFTKLSDDELYESLLKEYLNWYKGNQ